MSSHTDVFPTNCNGWTMVGVNFLKNSTLKYYTRHLLKLRHFLFAASPIYKARDEHQNFARAAGGMNDFGAHQKGKNDKRSGRRRATACKRFRSSARARATKPGGERGGIGTLIKHMNGRARRDAGGRAS